MEHPITRRGFLYGTALAVTTRPRPLAAAESESALDGLLGRRRMIRRFKSEAVSEAQIERLLRAAVRAPSAGHTKPWAFVVVRDPGMRQELGRAAFAQMFVASAPVMLVACADASRARPRYGKRAQRYALIDTAFASMCLLLAVTEERLGACFVGAFDDAEVARLLRLPSDVQPLAIIPVGYPDESPGRMKLRPFASVIHRERW